MVADDSGVVVAGAGGWAACEELAAYAPLLVRGEKGPGVVGRLAEVGSLSDIRSIDVDGQTILLCAQGPRAAEGVMIKVAEGVARILRQAA